MADSLAGLDALLLKLTQIVFLEEYKRSYVFYADGEMQMGY